MHKNILKIHSESHLTVETTDAPSKQDAKDQRVATLHFFRCVCSFFVVLFFSVVHLILFDFIAIAFVRFVEKRKRGFSVRRQLSL